MRIALAIIVGGVVTLSWGPATTFAAELKMPKTKASLEGGVSQAAGLGREG